MVRGFGRRLLDLPEAVRAMTYQGATIRLS